MDRSREQVKPRAEARIEESTPSAGSLRWDWLALAWAVVFGSLYARMVLEQRGGRLLALIQRVLGLGE